VRIKRKKLIASYYREHDEEIKSIIKLVEDDISRKVIEAQLNFIKNYDYSGHYNYLNKTGLLEKHNQLLDKDEYFPKGIITLTENEGFLDGGGFIGDTIKEFVLRSNGKFSHIFSFEPDKNNYIDLLAEVKKLNLKPDVISCYPKGLSSENKELRFLQKGIGSSISEHGTESIEVVQLDLFLSDTEKNKLTYIKLDIEGAELEALKGMKNIINKNKPKLAICVYHKLGDFWEIPLFIKSLNPEYKIFFRQYSLTRTDTICYAV